MKIDHLNLVVADLERSARFYEVVFGLRRGFTATLEGAWFEQVTGLRGARAECLFLDNPNGGTRLELIRYDRPSGDARAEDSVPHARGLRHVAFEVEDLESTLQKAREMGGEPISQPVEVPFRVAELGTKRLVYFLDPDGVLVEAAAYSHPV